MVSTHGIRGAENSVVFRSAKGANKRRLKYNHLPEYQVRQAFQPDLVRFSVRLESLTYIVLKSWRVILEIRGVIESGGLKPHGCRHPAATRLFPAVLPLPACRLRQEGRGAGGEGTLVLPAPNPRAPRFPFPCQVALPRTIE